MPCCLFDMQRSSSTVCAKVLYSSHNPKWQQQHQDELQERGGSLSVIYNTLNSSTLLIVCITRNQTRGKTNKNATFYSALTSSRAQVFHYAPAHSLRGLCGNRNRDYGGKGKPLQTASVNTIKEKCLKKPG